MKKYIITSKAGMPPFSTATTRAAAEADSREARQLGLDGEIIEEPAQKSYQQIAGDSTTDRAVGGDNAPASPDHTPEIAAIPGADETLLRDVLEDAFATDTETEDQLCTLVTSLFSHTETQRSEIKALRDALENLCRQVEFTKYDFPPEILPEHKGSAIHVAWEAARAALKGATK